MLTDEQIAAMGPEERQALIRRLSAPLELSDSKPVQRLVRRRRARLGLVTLSAVLLVPWTVYLGLTLPTHYQVRHWDVAWVGFDTLLLGLLSVTAVLGWRRRQLVAVTAFASGTVLLCDAWFDITTADVGDRPWSIASAVVVELPLALLLMGTSLRLLRMAAVHRWEAGPHQRVWDIPLPRLRAGIPGKQDDGTPTQMTATDSTSAGVPTAGSRTGADSLRG